ncbi:MAG: helix-turn-helix domain-containing protein [Candidatus Methanospirareceae archaeon]
MSELEKIFGRNAQLVVLEYLIRNRDSIMYLSGIAEATGLSHSSVARVIEPLIELDLVQEDTLGKQIRIFRLNEQNELLRLLIRFFDDLDELKGT